MGLSAALASARHARRILCVDAGDLGGEASLRSTRLWHGGIRYLDDGSESLVADGLAMRAAWMAAAGWAGEYRLAYALAQDAAARTRWGARVRRYTALASEDLPAPTWIPAEDVHRHVGGLHGWSGAGAWTYTEATFSESRVLSVMALEAQARGVEFARARPVLDATHDPDRGGWTIVLGGGVGLPEHVQTKAVIVATGTHTPAWAVRYGVEPVTAAWGTHLDLARDRWGVRRMMVYEHPEDGRIQYAIPQGGHVWLGTTEATAPDVERDQSYLVAGVQQLAPRVGASARWIHHAVTAARALIPGEGVGAARTGRVTPMGPQAVVLQGGKWTTAPYQALEAVRQLWPAAPDGARQLAHGLPNVVGEAAPPQDLHQAAGWWSRLQQTYGPLATIVARVSAELPHGMQRIPHTDVRYGEIAYLAAWEGATDTATLLRRLGHRDGVTATQLSGLSGELTDVLAA
jgi:glycerol-3-phosphate dehydrogenase